MKKIKVIFIQAMMISTAASFGIGIQLLLEYCSSGNDYVRIPWYLPLSVVAMGLISAVPTVILLDADSPNKKGGFLRIVIHFLLVGGIVSLCGHIFSWYSSVSGLVSILGIYVVIYVFIWGATMWLMKVDEKKINEAIEDLRDEE